MSRIQKILLPGLIFLLVISLSPSQAQLGVGEKLPVFQLPDVNGKPVALESYLGKVVLIHLWKCK